TIRALQKRLPGALLEDEVVEKSFEVQGDDERMLQALTMLAITAAKSSAILDWAFEVVMRSPRADVRAAAVGLMGFRCYPEQLPLLEALAERDPSEAVRRRALALLPDVRNRARGEEARTAAQLPRYLEKDIPF